MMYIFPSKDTIIDAVFKGIFKARENFVFWTRDELFMFDPSPKILSTHIAQAIANIDNPPEIFMDATIADILRCSLPSRSAYPSFMKERGIKQDVISLTLDDRFEHQNDNDSISRVIISVNNSIKGATKENKKEIETMCKMLDRQIYADSTLDYAVFAFNLEISKDARKKADVRIAQMIESFDAIVARYKNLQSNFKGGEINTIDNVGQWSVGCYIIEPALN